MKPITGKMTGIQSYRALLSLALEHKTYFMLAVIGMVIFAISEAAFAYMMKPLLDDGFINRDPLIIRLIPLAIILIFATRMVAISMRTYCMDYIGRNVINSLRNLMFNCEVVSKVVDTMKNINNRNTTSIRGVRLILTSSTGVALINFIAKKSEAPRLTQAGA